MTDTEIATASGSPSTPPVMRTTANKRKSQSLPTETVEYLKAWMMSPEHIAHPYPTEQEKHQIMAETGITMKQLTNWFVNNRKRYWKPRVEARLQQQAHAAACAAHVQVAAAAVAAAASLGVVNHPVTPDSSSSFRSQSFGGATPSHNGFVSFDLVSPAQQSGNSASLLMNQARALQAAAARSVANVSEVSSSTSSIVSEADSSESSSSEECTHKKQTSDLPLAAPVTPQSNYKRKVTALGSGFNSEDASTPRSKFRRVSIDIWKESCSSTSDGYCHTLPTMEEAALLFGFSQS